MCGCVCVVVVVVVCLFVCFDVLLKDSIKRIFLSKKKARKAVFKKLIKFKLNVITSIS